MKTKNNGTKINKALKCGFTIVEVSILFVIFLIVALLVAPMSLDDNLQVKNISKWKNVQSDFANIIYSVNTQKKDDDFDFTSAFNAAMKDQIKSEADTYKVSYLDGTTPSGKYRFSDFNLTYSNAIVAYKLYSEPKDSVIGILMYDVNGMKGPNTWGKDVFGLNIYSDYFEPFCKNDSIQTQKQDCSKTGTGLCCSNYQLIGGNVN